ncbi:MAG: XTP/dITP diphosphatase [Infirmifilum sp.]
MKIYIATSNQHKLAELSLALAPYRVQLVPVRVKKIEIQSNNVEEIAAKAAESLSPLDHPVAVEDSGLYIEALKGFPGPYSHYAYETIGIMGVLKLLEGVENRRALFVSAIAVKTPEGRVEVFKGETEGKISFQARGEGGFGFDPIFLPAGSQKTFAEMSIEEKNEYSHRGKAARKLGEWLIKNYSSL